MEHDDDASQKHGNDDNEGMSRGKQTAWIVTAIIFAAIVVLIGVRAMQPKGPCEGFWGKDRDCVVNQFIDKWGS